MNGKTYVEPRTYAVAKVWKCSLCSRLMATLETNDDECAVMSAGAPHMPV